MDWSQHIKRPSGRKPSPEFWPEDLALERIEAISVNARATWFGLLGLLTFVLVTLLGVEDVDFFGYGQETQLPLIGVSVPTVTFFIAAPILTTAVYAYFHFYLLKLWDALGKAPAKIDGDPLGERIHPWLLSDAALIFRQRFQDDGSTAPRALARVSCIASFILTWVYGWAVLGRAWWVTLPAHQPSLSLAIFSLFLIAVFIGLVSVWELLRRVGWRDFSSPIFVVRNMAIISTGVATIFLPKIFAATGSWEAAEHYIPLTRADLVAAHLTEKPTDWQDRDVAEEAAREVWCERRNVPSSLCIRGDRTMLESVRQHWCQNPGSVSIRERVGSDCRDFFSQLELDFRESWDSQRTHYLSVLNRAPLVSRDLRQADLKFAFAPYIFLQEGDLRGADMRKAELESANLFGADLRDSSLYKTGLIASDLQNTTISGALFYKSRLDQANFAGAAIEGSVFRSVKMRNAYWTGAKIGAITLHYSDLSGGEKLTQDQLARAIGNEKTTLPKSEKGEQLHIWSCWDELPTDLPSKAGALEYQSTTFLNGTYGDLEASWICSATNPLTRTGQTECGVQITNANYNKPELLRCPEGP